MTTSSETNQPLSLSQVLICGAAIVTLAMGIRHGFGLWLQPITSQYSWTRENFAFAIAIQNLSWGVAGIAAGMLADKLGAFKVIIGGALLYALGLFGMAYAATPFLFALSAGVLIGAAQAGTTYAVIYGVIGRNVPAEKRSWAMGVAAAAGSFGQFLMVPTEGFLISSFGWQQALVMLGFATLLMIPLSFGLREHAFSSGSVPAKRDQTILEALKEAFKYPSFQLLMAGYFVCGFQFERQRLVAPSCQLCAGFGGFVQCFRHLYCRLVRSKACKTQNIVFHLLCESGFSHPLHTRAINTDECLYIC
jgi:MFS family permease